MTALPLTGLAGQLRSGTMSALDATQEYLERIERLDGRVRSYITVTAESAREEARRAECIAAHGAILRVCG